MAQLGARLDGIEEVVGSNPIGSTSSSQHVFPRLYSLERNNKPLLHWSDTGRRRAPRLPQRDYSKLLRNRGPWRLVYEEEYKTRAQAMRREREIKSWKDRAMIERLVSASR